jgi:hypothetical protein
MFAYHRQTLPPSGVCHAVSLRLTPSSLQSNALPGSPSRIIRNLVVARNNFLQIFHVVESIDTHRPEDGAAVENDDVHGEEAALGEELQVSFERIPCFCVSTGERQNFALQINPCLCGYLRSFFIELTRCCRTIFHRRYEKHRPIRGQGRLHGFIMSANIFCRA